MADIDTTQLSDPEALGAVRVEGFADDETIGELQEEVRSADVIGWRDAHEVYTNARGLTIVQNHDTFALELALHSTEMLEELPHIQGMMHSIGNFVCVQATQLPTMANWSPNELSLHRYDDPEIGLSFHRDNTPYVGIIAILSVFGECDFSVRHNDQERTFPARPGDLFLLRGTDLIDYDGEIRPEHTVTNITTGQRISMMLRQNRDPEHLIRSFKFNNVS